MMGRPFFWCSVGILGVLAFSGRAVADPVLFQAAGPNATAIQSSVDAFRNQLGALNPNLPGSNSQGRRQITWDGVPPANSAPNNMPATQFINAGTIFATPGIGFQVSGTAPAPTLFTNINPTYANIFAAFSSPKLFTALGSTITDVNFFIAGTTNVVATVSGFGAVFSDVDRMDSTSIAYFDGNDRSLGSFVVPASSGNQTFSFLGVFFNAEERIGRVRITSGNTALGPNETGQIDLVVMDDFIFGEPRIVPEPGSLTLLGLGLVGLVALRRFRKGDRAGLYSKVPAAPQRGRFP